jgi:sulfite reductase (NADPH) hemoprotein beta-component
VYLPGEEAYARWRATNVGPQKQFGYVTATATVPLGDLTCEQMRVLAELARAYSDATVRVTVDQNLLFRWVAVGDVRELYRRLSAASLGLAEAATAADVASCPGAESCRLAVTQSRGLGRVLGDHLLERPDLVGAHAGMDIKNSGCPNGCGQHHIAGIGFQGSLKKIGSQPAPQYFVMVGGGVGDGITTFGRLAAKIPARRCVPALERLVKLYQDQRADQEAPLAFFRRVELGAVKAVLADLERLLPDEAEPQDFIDLAEVSAFNPEVMEGECSA